MFFIGHSDSGIKKIFRPRNVLVIIAAMAFVIRITPFFLLGIPIGLDSYLHLSVAQELADTGFPVLLDPMSLLGLKAYSYPPLFHLILAGLLAGGGGIASAHLMSSLLGAACVPLVYLTALEVFGRKDKNRKIALLAAFFMATAPSHIFRTAIPMPESLGVFMYCLSFLFAVRFVKTGGLKYGILTAATVVVYGFSHRGWLLFILTLFVYLTASKAETLRKKRNLTALAAFVAALCLAINQYFSELIQRLQLEPVSALGYFKWVGIAHLILGFWGIVIFAGVKDRTQRFVMLIASILLLLGSISFRFRDPYAALPMSLLAAYVMAEKIVPMAKKAGDRKLMAAGIIAVCVSQALVSAVCFVDYPQPGERQALSWLRQNTPENSIILTWKEEGHYVIGLAGRKDIVMWKKFYEGFFSNNPPSVDEAKEAYNDVGIMFRTRDTSRMLGLMKQYRVDYIYIDKKMRTEFTAIQFGLVEYLGIDTRFRPVMINDDAEIYQVVWNGTIAPENHAGAISSEANLSAVAGADAAMAERAWTGLAYIDLKTYKAGAATNARIAAAYAKACKERGEQALCARSEWLVKWLGFQQLIDGAWTDQDFTMPRKSTQVTCQVVDALLSAGDALPEAKTVILNAAKYIKSQTADGFVMTFPGTSQDFYKTDSVCLPVLLKLAELTGDHSFSASARKVAAHIAEAQGGDGSWKYSETTSQDASADSQATMLYGIAAYHYAAGGRGVEAAVEKGMKYLESLQNGDGSFPAYSVGSRTRYVSKESYARAALIYGMAGMEDQKRKTLGYLAGYAGSKPLTLGSITEMYFILGISPAGLRVYSDAA